MLLGIILILAALAGIVFGIVRKRRGLIIASAIALIAILAAGFYFYQNPY